MTPTRRHLLHFFSLLLFMTPKLLWSQSDLQWNRRTDLPNPFGLAGPFAGISQGHLLVAGGANFPNRPPWEKGTKVWHDAIYAMHLETGEWATVGTLPQPIAYGVSLSLPHGLLCLGGGDATTHSNTCFLMQLQNGRIEFTPFPPLPIPMAYACGVLSNDVIYVFGGQRQPTDTLASHQAWSLDLQTEPWTWRELPTWPGPPRILATAAAYQDDVLLLGGVELQRDANQQPRRHYLQDTYRLLPNHSWETLDPLPTPSAASPSPAIVHQNILYLLGGDDGSQIGQDPSTHRGFSLQAQRYDLHHQRWLTPTPIPFAMVTTPIVPWNDSYIIPSGEIRPGIRSPHIWQSLPLRPTP